LGEEVTKEEVEVMIEMADKTKKGGVDLQDFIALMKEVGLIPSNENS
jgi:Ca2+-binding EF-hand superfamily protein